MQSSKLKAPKSTTSAPLSPGQRLFEGLSMSSSPTTSPQYDRTPKVKNMKIIQDPKAPPVPLSTDMTTAEKSEKEVGNNRSVPNEGIKTNKSDTDALLGSRVVSEFTSMKPSSFENSNASASAKSSTSTMKTERGLGSISGPPVDAQSSKETSSPHGSRHYARKSHMDVSTETPILNSDVMLRLLRKFATKTQANIPQQYGGAQSPGVLRYIFGTKQTEDPNMAPYKSLMDIILVDEVENNSLQIEDSNGDKELQKVFGRSGDNMKRARHALSAFCHLLSVWGHASSCFFEMEDSKSQQAYSQLLCAAFDIASELVSHGCLDGVEIIIGAQVTVPKGKLEDGDDMNHDNGNKNKRKSQNQTLTPNESTTTYVINILTEAIFNADLTIKTTELAAMKFLLSAGCRVYNGGQNALLRGTHLLQAIRMLYHIYLTTDIEANRTTARASLQQLVTSIFTRLVRTTTATTAVAAAPNATFNVNGSALDNFPSENHRDAFLVLRSICKLSMRNLPDPNMHSHIGLQSSGSNTLWDSSKDVKKEERSSINSSTVSGTQDKSTRDNSMVVPAVASSAGRSENKSVTREHAHLIYTNAMHSALESKILALELLYYVLENVEFSRLFVQQCGFQFHNAIRNYLCVSLLKNCTSDNTKIVNLSLQMFVPLVHNFRTILKNEIEAFVTNVFFVILDSKNSSMEHKSLVVTLFEEICSDAATLAEIFLNYDCDLSAVDLFHRIVNTLSKVAQSSEEESIALYYMNQGASRSSFSFIAGAGAARLEKLRNGHRELRLDAMRALRQVLASLQASIVEPMDGIINNQSHGKGGAALAFAPGVSFAALTDEEKSCTGSESIESIHSNPSTPDAKHSLVQIYDSKKKRRQEESEVILRFSQKPSAGISYATKCGHVNGSDATDVARYLLQNKDIFDKTQIGEYLGREPDYQNGFSLRVLHEYVRLLDFKDLLFDDAIRYYLSGFRLPGEAQKIDRIMEKFAERYTEQNHEIFPTADVAFILAFSIIMLNTDLHNPAIKEERRMTKDGFIRNNRGICDGQDLPEELLTSIFDRIKENPISLKEDDEARDRLGDSIRSTATDITSLPAGLSPASFFTSHYDEMDRTRETNFQKERDHILRTTESLLKRRRHMDGKQHRSSTNAGKSQQNASASPNKFHRSKFVRTEDSGLRDEYVSPMFEVTWGPALAAFSTAMESANGTVGALTAIASDEELELAAENAAETIEVCLTGFRFAICISGLCGNDIARDAYMLALSRFSSLGTGVLLEPRHVRCIQTMMSIARDDGELLGSTWEHIFKALAEINRFHQLFHLMARNDRAAAAAAERRRQRLEEIEIKKSQYRTRQRERAKQQQKEKSIDATKVLESDEANTDSATADEIYTNSVNDHSAHGSYASSGLSIESFSTEDDDDNATNESDLFSSDSDFYLYDDEMDKKAIDEANARAVYEAVSEALIEAIYQRSSSLSHRAVKEFVLHLCRVSRMEISVKGYGGHVGSNYNAVDLTQVQYRHSHAALLNDTAPVLYNFDDTDKHDDPIADAVGSQFHHSQPNIYNLQKLVEVTHYNMESRPRLIFGEIWNTVSGHLTSTALHLNPAVAMYAVDSFRQLSIQYLERKEPEVFEFQRRFLKPLETVIVRSEHDSAKELLLKCVDRIIFLFASSEGNEYHQTSQSTSWESSRKGNLRSGWVPLLYVLGHAGTDSNINTAKLGYKILKDQLLKCLDMEQSGKENSNTFLSEHFVDVVTALMKYVTGPHQELSLLCIGYLVSLCDYLANDNVQRLVKRKNASSETSMSSESKSCRPEAPGKQELDFWWPILLGMSRSIGDNRIEVRAAGLNGLFQIINNHFFPESGDSCDSQLQTLQLIFRGVLTPILEFADTAGTLNTTSLTSAPQLPSDFERFIREAPPSETEKELGQDSASETNDWIGTTFENFMNGCTEICLRSISKYNDDSLIEEMFALLNSCLLSDSGELAVNGLHRLERFVMNDIDAKLITNETWATVCHMMRRCLSIRGLPRKVSSSSSSQENCNEERQQSESEETDEVTREFILEDRILPSRRYIGSNAAMVIGSLLSNCDKLLEMIEMRWRLFLICGLGNAIHDWERASIILESNSSNAKNAENDNAGVSPPDYLETAIYGRKVMNRLILQLASMKDMEEHSENKEELDSKGNPTLSPQTIIIEQTHQLLFSLVEKESVASESNASGEIAALYERLTDLALELLRGFADIETDHLKRMTWLNPILFELSLQTQNESVRAVFKQLIESTSPS